MTEFVTNSVKMFGPDEQIEELKKNISGTTESGEFIAIDFNEIIESPECLKYKSKIEYQEWCNDNWGCIGNVEFSKYVGNNVIVFDTIDGDAYKVITHLSSIYPEILFQGEFTNSYSKYSIDIKAGEYSNPACEYKYLNY